MKRSFDEISDEEWSNHNFKPNRIILKTKPIESFSYKNTNHNSLEDEYDEEEVGATITQSRARRFVVDSDEDFKAEEEEEDGDDDEVEEVEEVEEEVVEVRAKRRGRRRETVVHVSDDDFVDDDDDEVLEVRASRNRRGRVKGRRRERMVYDDDDDDDDDDGEEEEEVEVKASRSGRLKERERRKRYEVVDEEEEDGVVEVVREKDLVGKALFKCAKISKELRKELYGSKGGLMGCDRYAEVEDSSVRIVTQEDINNACTTKDSEFQPILKPYQLVGVNFLLLLYRKEIAGAILADEMGLGKTIQAVTYLSLLKCLHKDPGPHLIVCPASVLENWERELTKWCPSFSILQYHGSARVAYYKELSSFAKAGLPPPYNVILVCYSLFERRSAQQKDDRKMLRRWRWSCVIMDEAHALKDKNSYRWKNLMHLARNSNQRLMLTGTPLQNDLHELWTMLEFMMPNLFATGDVDLKKLLNGEDKELITRIKSILGPFILRRLKSDVMQQLVQKTHLVEYVNMEVEQEAAYKEAIEYYRAAVRARVNKSSKHSCYATTGNLPRRQLSNYFCQFRKIANHPLLIRRIYNDKDVVRIAEVLYPKGAFGFECKMERAVEELQSYNDYGIHRLLLIHAGSETKGILGNEHVFLSAKCCALARLLPPLKNNGHRVLIFSQWTSMLDILEWTLDVLGFTYRRLDGSTQVTERQDIVDTFNNDESIFACLLSTRAGGQGINLTGADTVIIHDMDFNPQIDRQAEDRCHRIGQTKPVTVYRLVTKSTVDENIYEIAKRKLTLDAAVLDTDIELDSGTNLPEKTMGEILSALLMG